MTSRLFIPILTLIFVFGGFCAEASVESQISQAFANGRSSLNGQMASLYYGECKAVPGESQAESDRIEAIYFPLAAKKLLRMSHCETMGLTKLIQAGYASKFIRKVTLDIAVKLSALRGLSQNILRLTKEIDGLNRDNNGYDSQMARFGYLDRIQLSERAVITARMAKDSAQLKPLAAAYKVLLASIWRAEDPAMASYLAALIQSHVSVAEFRRQSLQPQPRWMARHIYGNFSFLDNVIKPMISDTQKLMKTITDDYQQTPTGLHFLPGYSTRKLLATNMDLLYEPENPTPRFTHLACELDYKYSTGEDSLETTVSTLLLFGGPAGKLVPLALRAVKLERLIEGSLFIDKALSAMGVLGAGTMLAMTADSAYQTCTTNFATVNKSAEFCSPNETIEDVTNFEARVLDKHNCALLMISTAVSQTTVGLAIKKATGLFNPNSNLIHYINQAQKLSDSALKYKNQGQQITNSAGTSKDFIKMLSGKKDDDDDKDKDKADEKTDNKDQKSDKDDSDNKNDNDDNDETGDKDAGSSIKKPVSRPDNNAGK